MKPEQVGAKVKEAAMTGGEVLIEQGRQEVARPMFLALLRARFGEVSPAATRRVESASFEEIQRWMQTGDAARSAEELLGL